ncbi:hypothetical protein FHS15_001462 [Paenibacillus castaneae]|uniref:hypothetical protein n=1 Tax=Paenibacillus castaneae TaxID=474957 RepID=UPI000C9A21CE|nr:hypothetical protein [Paenibacillus castaneae]NIK76355.1 hypothetical protein [Paenibacillus castaneae]
MEQIYPLHEDVVKRYCGYPVCVIMNDGSRHVGILSSCHGGQVWLNADEASIQGHEASLTNVHSDVSKKKKGGKGNKAIHKSSQTQAQTQAYPYAPYDNGYGPQYNNGWGWPVLLDFALIAFLFLLL